MPYTAPDIAGRRVVLGLSGGVDSAVAALLLKRAGADVHALHMTNWEDDDGYCTAAADLQDARRVCEQIGIPLHHVNFADDYRKRVFAYFLAEYRAGRTPNPDVLCNREIKFGSFREHAKRLGSDLIGTGHYAQVSTDDAGNVQLLKGADSNKDQSYFLHAVSSAALAETVFPLGHLQKPEVRSIARDNGLWTQDKKDSTGICFIGERPFREFLATYLPARPGPIKTLEGTEVGTHSGLMFYTPGQRQGLGIGGRQNAGDAPWYVADKVLEDNTLVVVQGDHERLYCQEAELFEETWINDVPDAIDTADGWTCAVKIRYRQADQACTVRRLPEGRLQILFGAPQRAVAPGQFAVFYAGDRCMGGAVIDRLRRNPIV